MRTPAREKQRPTLPLWTWESAKSPLVDGTTVVVDIYPRIRHGAVRSDGGPTVSPMCDGSGRLNRGAKSEPLAKRRCFAAVHRKLEAIRQKTVGHDAPSGESRDLQVEAPQYVQEAKNIKMHDDTMQTPVLEKPSFDIDPTRPTRPNQAFSW